MHDDDTHPPAPPPPPAPAPPGAWQGPPPWPDQSRPPQPTPQWQQPTPQWQQPPAPGQYDPRFAQPAAQPYVPGYVPEGWVPELGVRIAGAGTRIGAKAIDIVVYLVISVVLGIVTSLFLLSSGATVLTPTTEFGGDIGFGVGAALAVAAITILVDFLYNVVCTAQFGGTPGKLMLGLRVIRTDGRAVDLGVAFRRWTPILVLLLLGSIPADGLNPVVAVLGLFAAFARLGLLVANLVMVLTDERRRSVFDRVGGTYVITTR